MQGGREAGGETGSEFEFETEAVRDTVTETEGVRVSETDRDPDREE